MQPLRSILSLSILSMASGLLCAQAEPEPPSEPELSAAPEDARVVPPGIQIFGSMDGTWSLADGRKPTPVCLTDTMPRYCPQDRPVVVFNYPGIAWDAQFSDVPFEAGWVWDGRELLDGGPAELSEFQAYRLLEVPRCSGPVVAEIWIAADDFAEVRANGVLVGQIGSTTDHPLAVDAQSRLHLFSLTPFLTPGVTNVLEVRAVNARNQCVGCSFRDNPAGVVFGGAVSCAAR